MDGPCATTFGDGTTISSTTPARARTYHSCGKMIFTRPAVARLACNSPKSFQSSQVLESFISRLTSSAKPYSSIASSSAFRRNPHDVAHCARAQFGLYAQSAPRSSLLHSRQHARTYASASPDIITKFEDLPAEYTDLAGLAYYSRPLTKEDAEAIFGPGTDPIWADRLLRVLQGRRVAGTLEDPSLPLAAPRMDKATKTMALSWLRRNIVVDERESAGLRAEIELAALEEESIARGEELGIYKKTESPQNKDSPYGKSGLDVLREVKTREWDEAAAKREEKRLERLAQIQEKTGTLATHDERGVELRRPGQNEKLKYYLEQAAKVVPDVPPEMSSFQRLWPSGLLALAVIGASTAFAILYTPPKQSARLFKDIPPAAATIIPIIAFNALVCVAWHFPPAFRVLNKYFLSVPGYPRALAVLGNAFSHQGIKHLAINMFILYLLGTRLHDDIGRANFLAIYGSAAVTGSFASLAYHVVKRNFHVTSLGASSAVYGIAAAFLFLHWNDDFRILGVLPPQPYPGVPGSVMFAMMLGWDLWGLRKGVGNKFDHMAHLGGAVSGMVAVEVLKRRAAARRREWLGRKNSAGSIVTSGSR